MLTFTAQAASSLVSENTKHFVRNRSYISEEFTAWLHKDQEQGGIIRCHHLS